MLGIEHWKGIRIFTGVFIFAYQIVQTALHLVVNDILHDVFGASAEELLILGIWSYVFTICVTLDHIGRAVFKDPVTFNVFKFLLVND